LGLPQGGIAVSQVADLEQFLQLGIDTGTVKATEREQIVTKVQAMRDALPKSVFAAVAELEAAIKGKHVNIPKPLTAQDIDACRKQF
jgi:hypothetical protein